MAVLGAQAAAINPINFPFLLFHRQQTKYNCTIGNPVDYKTMSSYGRKSKAVAAQSESGYSAKELREIFNQMDTNEDGGLGLFEIKEALKQLDAEFPVHLAFKALCQSDRNKDGKLGRDEIDKFIKYLMSEGYVV